MPLRAVGEGGASNGSRGDRSSALAGNFSIRERSVYFYCTISLILPCAERK